jgi:hypothetical protein
VAIRLATNGEPHIEVDGIPSDSLKRFAAGPPDRLAWQKALALYVESDSTRPLPVIGDYCIQGGRLIFKRGFGIARFSIRPSGRGSLSFKCSEWKLSSRCPPRRAPNPRS